MPELPEVQTVVNDLLTGGLPGRTITGAQVFWPRTIAGLSPDGFCQQVAGQRIAAIWRRGKYLVFDLTSGDHLLIHLRMSGRLHLVSPDVERGKHEHVLLNLDSGQQLRFHDTRKFGRIYLVRELDAVVGSLGPEPLEESFTVKVFARRLHAHKRQLKPLLLDQSFVAGLGNIYVDEALWEARLHPLRLSSTLNNQEIQALHGAIRQVLNRGIQNLGTTLGTGKANFYSVGKRSGGNSAELQVFRRTNAPCPRCQTPIERLIVGQRSTHLCPTCQKR